MDLVELLQQAQRLTNETKMDTEMPGVERTMSQVLQATQELHSRVTQTGTNDLQAHILLGSKGVDLPRLTQKLETLSARQSFEPLDPVTDTDVQGYLKNERENAILSVIEETNRSIFECVNRQKWRCVYAEWGEDKEALLNALVGPSQQDFPGVQRQMVPTSMADEPTPFTRMTAIQQLYAKHITAYNESVIQGTQHPKLVSTLSKLAADSFDDPQVSEMWSVLEFMSAVSQVTRSNDPIKNRQSPEFVQQARTYLELRYKTYMNRVIEKNLALARRGGIPDVYHLVSSYVAVTFQKPQSLYGLLDVNNGRPLWPLVYYSLRSGDMGAAIRYLKESGTCPDLVKLMTLQKMGSNDTSTAKLEGQLKLEYSSNMNDCTDSYKRAVFVIMLACDTHDSHGELLSSIDDFLWIQLSTLRVEGKRDYNNDQLTYSDLQMLILEKYGENYFNAREKAPLYFQVLTLTGQFESALEFLARTEINRPHAVHMAIALNELAMLGSPRSISEPLLSSESNDPKPMKRLNLVRLAIMYAKCFEQTDTEQALQYYYLLRDFKCEDGINALLSCASDLIVENCDAKMLELVFGVEDEHNSFRRSGGIIEKFHTADCDKYLLADMVGDELSKRSNYESAIALFFIAGQLEKVVRLVCSLLSQVVHQPAREGSIRERLGVITARLDTALVERKKDVDPHLIVTYTMLAQLMEFFDHYHAGASGLAAEIVTQNHIIPTSPLEVDECVINLKYMGPEVIKVLPDVLLASMNIVYEEYVNIRGTTGSGSVYGDDSKSDNKDSVLAHLRGRAKALTNLAACVSYRMPATTNQRLVQLEILMH
ncbi:nuclear pore complex protein Nup93-1 [Drosophila eugracilis]|uniref:nuclear pore complex protein Nup93-1 n=1 Tax=Drosophila eugracilis TaxID=29029 RepID=UPI0007E708BD|nr:nuclear pore complex protein Nup93-1 [Drosophila eugracilis]